MTATEIIKYQIDTVGTQLDRSLDGLDDGSLGYRLHENGLSVGEEIGHLAEAYQAVITTSEGGKHEWGNFKLKGTTVKEMLDETTALRTAATAKVLRDDDESLKMGADYIIAHDNYHLGQLVTIRLGLNPSWNSYEIYG